MREKLNISEDDLIAALQSQYGLAALSLEFLPLGLDTNAGIYRVVSDRAAAYLLKVKSGMPYESSCLVPRYLRDQGISSVVAPLPTIVNALWTQMNEWTLFLYPFVEGTSGWEASLTDGQWRAVGNALSQIHHAHVPIEGFASIHRETFSTTEYARSIETLESQHIDSQGGGRLEVALRAAWLSHQAEIYEGISTLATLADVLRAQTNPFVICHADLHPGNIIRDQADRVFIIDWDDVMLAPKERDFIYVGEPPAGTDEHQSVAPFFQGYGSTEIDWVSLTYYRWERIIQDVIVCAQTIFLRDDLGDLAKEEEFGNFENFFRDLGAVMAAAAHIPANLR